MARPSAGVFLTPGEVAAKLQVSRATAYSLIERRVGLALRIGSSELEEFLGGR